MANPPPEQWPRGWRRFRAAVVWRDWPPVWWGPFAAHGWTPILWRLYVWPLHFVWFAKESPSRVPRG